MPGPLSSHHDDHHGRADGYAAHCARVGAGADSRRRWTWLSSVVCCFSQLVTLYLTPVFYTYMDGLQRWLAGYTGNGGGPSAETCPC